ncbi:hypothetical protein WDU94_011499 [Cyamophila willieti]
MRHKSVRKILQMSILILIHLASSYPILMERQHLTNYPKGEEDVKQAVENSTPAKGDSNNDSRLSDDIEIVEEDNDQPKDTTNNHRSKMPNQNTPTDDNMPKIKIKSVRSLQAEEIDKIVADEDKQHEDDIEVLNDSRTSVTSSGNIVTSRQKPSSIQALLADKSLSGNENKHIDIYGFMLHNGIGYLPICQYSPQQLYLIFKDPTKRDTQSIIFHGTDYLQKASTWANGFLNNYIKFHPKYSQNPVWKIIKFSTTKELGNWKLFDFKFLKDYAPMVLTSEGMYKVKNKILYKLLLVPGHKAVFKFKQVMEAKLDMDDVSFIEKYEYFHNCHDIKKPIRFIQRMQVCTDQRGLGRSSGSLGGNSAVPSNTPPTTNSTTISPISTLPSPPIAPKPGAIFVKPAQSLLQRPMTQTYLKPSAPVRSIPNVSQMMHRKNIMDNLTRLAMQRMKSSPPQTGQNLANQGQSLPGSQSYPNLPVSQSSMLPNHNLLVNQSNLSMSMLPPGIAGNPLMGSFTPRNPVDLLQYIRTVGRPPLHPQDQRPLNPSVVKVDNLEKYGKFIQISDLITGNNNSGNGNPPPSIINKSHPILCKSLAIAPTPEPEKVCIEKLPADGKDTEDTSNDIEASLDSFKISKMRGEDSNNNNAAISSGQPSMKNMANLGIHSNNLGMNSNHMINMTNNSGSNSKMNKINPGSTMNMNVYKPRNSTSPAATSVSNNPLFNPRNNTTNSNVFNQRNPPIVTSQGNSTPRNSTSSRKPPVPGLKPLKPLPGLKAINPIAGSPMGQLSVSPKVPSVSPVPSKRLTEEVDISVSPVKSTMSSPVEINLNSSGE